MSKNLQTVYVPTEFKNREVLLKFLNGVDSKWAKPLQAYLYTEQEHQAAQQALSAAPTTQDTNVLDVLEKIDKSTIDDILERNNVYPESQKQTAIRDGKIGTMYDRIRASMLEFAAIQVALSTAQGYRDALEKIIHIIKDETLDISQTIDFAEETAQQALSAAPTTQEPSKAEDRREGAVMSECYFTPSKKTTSSTICENCGQEKYLHTIGDGVKVSSVIITTQQTNVLDELEKWVKAEIDDFQSSTDKTDKSVASYLSNCVLTKIQSLNPQPTNNGWISVEDMLPETNKNVLIFSNDREIGEATKGRRDIDGRYFTVCGMQLFEVTHWQQLPQKPQP